MHSLNKIIERNAEAQAAYEHEKQVKLTDEILRELSAEELKVYPIDGDFTRELKETVLLYTTTAQKLAAVEEQVLFLARRLLALKAGQAWSEEPLWKIDANL